MRVLLAAATLALAACGPTETPAAEPTPPATPAVAAPAAEPAPPPAAAEPSRIGAMEMTCGNETLRVAFEDARAVVVGEDGSNMELPLLEDQPGATPSAVKTFTNGVMTFNRETTADGASHVKFARGRMAFQECVVPRT